MTIDLKQVARRASGLIKAKKVEAVTTILKHNTLAKSSQKQYASAVRRLKSFVNEMKAPRLTMNLFKAYLAALAEEGHKGVETPRQVLSALRHFQKVEGLWNDPDGTQWSLDPALDAICKGLAYDGKAERKARGAITADMLRDLCKYCRESGLNSLVPAYQIAYAASLRVSQVATLKVGSLFTENGLQFLHVFKDKRVRAGSRRGEYHVKLISAEGARIFQQLASERNSNEYLFDPASWKYPKLLQVIKDAAAALGWLEGLQWVFHGTRHGGAMALRNASSSFLTSALQMSVGTVQHYTKPNAKRLGVLSDPKQAKPTVAKKAVPKKRSLESAVDPKKAKPISVKKVVAKKQAQRSGVATKQVATALIIAKARKKSLEGCTETSQNGTARAFELGSVESIITRARKRAS